MKDLPLALVIVAWIATIVTCVVTGHNAAAILMLAPAWLFFF